MATDPKFACFSCGATYARSHAEVSTPALKDYHICPHCGSHNRDDCASERAQTTAPSREEGSRDGKT